jgi:hypothetical protein
VWICGLYVPATSRLAQTTTAQNHCWVAADLCSLPTGHPHSLAHTGLPLQTQSLVVIRLCSHIPGLFSSFAFSAAIAIREVAVPSTSRTRCKQVQSSYWKASLVIDKGVCFEITEHHGCILLRKTNDGSLLGNSHNRIKEWRDG